MKKAKKSVLRDKSGINKLVEIKDECLDEIEIVALDDPREPIMTVNNRILAIRSGVHNYRSHYVLPMVIGAWCFLFFLLSDLGPAKVVVENARYQIDRYERANGVAYSETRYLFYKNMMGKNGEASTIDYLRAIYLYGGEELKNSKQHLLMFILIMLIISTLFTYWYVRFRIMAYIFFDRERQIVYTWRKGRVAACRFENIGFREETVGLRLFLYGEKKKAGNGYTYKEVEFLVQPSEAMFFNQKRDNNLLLAQLFAFMDDGKQAVIKGSSFERKLPRTWQAKDKKPEDFDARLDEILKHEHDLPGLYLKRLI